MLTAIEIVRRQGYISFFSLKREMDAEFGDFNEEDFKRDFEELSQGCNSPIGIIDQAQANEAILSSKVFYSREWMEKNRNSFLYKPAEVIGLDLYKKIRENGWDCYNGKEGQLSWRDLKDHGYDCVMDYAWVPMDGNGYIDYNWGNFREKYSGLMEYINISPDLARQFFNKVIESIIQEKNIVGAYTVACMVGGYELTLPWLMDDYINASLWGENLGNLLRAACAGHPLAKAKLCLHYHKEGQEQEDREYLERSKLYCDEAIPLLRAMLERDTHVQSVERMLKAMESRGFEEARHCLAEWRDGVMEDAEDDEMNLK